MRIHRLSWIPPFAVGLAAAVAGEVAVGLLLYVTPGFVRALTLILAVLLSSFALGLWTAPSAHDDTLPERLRRRWVLLLFAFGAAALISGIWSVRGGLAAQAYTRGLGLAFLAALPLYSCGALLGGMSAPKLHVKRQPVGAAAAAGASLGTILAGYVLVATMLPVSIFAFCLVLLSASAIVHGNVLSADGEKTLSATEQTPFGPVSVEEWAWGKSRRERVLKENGRVRGLEDGDGRPVRRWERAVLELMSDVGSPTRAALPATGTPMAEGAAATDPDYPATSAVFAYDPGHPPLDPAVLLLGAGALTIPRHILARQPEVRVDVVERNQIVLDAAASHFYAPSEGRRLRLIHQDPSYGLAYCPGPYQAIVLEACAVAPEDPLPITDASELEALKDRLAPRGLVLVGGVDERAVAGVPLEGLLAKARKVFPTVAIFAPDASVRQAVGTRASAHEMLLVLSVDPQAALPESAGELRLESVARSDPTQPGSAAMEDLPGPGSLGAPDFTRPPDRGGIA